ncbi:MAG: glycosyltransferase family 4 protein [Candidatus Rokubacteria bacterium]|nr:glycosyltransferase family 4 protein [Candidatus Rokubacteria bacterium]
MIRVLELLTTTTLGGGPRHVYDLVRHLPAGEFEVAVAGPRDGAFFERFHDLRLAVSEIGANRLSVRALIATLRLVSGFRTQVIHSHGKGAGLYGRLAARWTGVPAVHTFHGLHYESYQPRLQQLYLGIERRLSRWTHTIINVSRTQEAEALALRLVEPRQNVTVVNGVDLDTQDRIVAAAPIPRERFGLGRDLFVLGTVARFDPVKRLDTLVSALRALERPRVSLLLVGGGPESDRLQRLVAAAHLGGRVIFAGWLDDSARVYPAIDLYVAVSAKEGLPLALLEAMGAGLAVVATDVPGHRDVVRDGETGLLVPAGDEQALAAAIETLMDDPVRRLQMGRAGRERVLKEFTVRSMVDKTAEIYRAAAAGTSGAGR